MSHQNSVYLCSACKEPVPKKAASIFCDGACQSWLHKRKRCSGLTPQEFQIHAAKGNTAAWSCPACSVKSTRASPSRKSVSSTTTTSPTTTPRNTPQQTRSWWSRRKATGTPNSTPSNFSQATSSPRSPANARKVLPADERQLISTTNSQHTELDKLGRELAEIKAAKCESNSRIVRLEQKIHIVDQKLDTLITLVKNLSSAGGAAPPAADAKNNNVKMMESEEEPRVGLVIGDHTVKGMKSLVEESGLGYELHENISQLQLENLLESRQSDDKVTDVLISVQDTLFMPNPSPTTNDTTVEDGKAHPAKSLLCKVGMAYPRAEVTFVTTHTTGIHSKKTKEERNRIIETCRDLRREKGMKVGHLNTKCTHQYYKGFMTHPRNHRCDLVRLVSNLKNTPRQA